MRDPQKIVVLLIDDQPIIAEAIAQMVAGEPDIELHYCEDPTNSLEMAASVHPTVILQDLLMPQMNGLLLIRFLRASPVTEKISLVVLSGKEVPATKAEAFALGANDYLTKLPDRVELIARIRYHSRSYMNLLERNEAYQALLASQQALAAELAKAADYVRSVLPAPLREPIQTAWRFLPCMQLGGDSFGYHWLDDDHLAIYLLDVCGHGVGAALLSVSVMNVLRSRSLPSTDFCSPAQVLTSLNQAFPMGQNNEMLFTMWYGVYDQVKRQLVYASGGHPPAVLVTGANAQEAEVLRLATRGLIVGALERVTFEEATCVVREFGELFVYSDGVYEVRKLDGTMLNMDEFIGVLTTRDRSVPALDFIQSYVCNLQSSDRFEDDFSILQLVF